ncbi:hypothetical protein ACSMXN_07285 [Jatrophihabitans sp. DSM 45814]
MLTALIPQVFYTDLSVGLDLFVDGIGMQVLHQEGDLVVAGRDQIKVYLVADATRAAQDRPELAIETDTLDADYADIAARRPDLLHPNLRQPKLQPWGPREFALLDASTVCIVFRQWN